MSRPIEYDGGISIDPSQFDAVQKGKAYRELLKSAGYKLLLDYMELRTSLALKAVREAKFADDRVKANFQLIWAEREEMTQDIEREVQRGIAIGKEVIEDLRETNVDIGFPMDFGDSGE